MKLIWLFKKVCLYTKFILVSLIESIEKEIIKYIYIFENFIYSGM